LGGRGDEWSYRGYLDGGGWRIIADEIPEWWVRMRYYLVEGEWSIP
jgi:hypothetical protein